MFSVVIAVFLISCIPFVVGIVASRLPAFKNKAMWFFVSFAAGVMLGNSFFDLLPESVESFGNGTIIGFSVVGISLFYLIEKYFLWHSHGSQVPNIKRTSVLVMAGDSLHNFIDGIVVAGAFLASPALGIITSISIALHEIPQELADFSILISDGISVKKALVLNFLSGLTALIGGILGYMFLAGTLVYVPYFTSFAAGMFIYIACSDLIPRTHEWDKDRFDIKTTLAFIVGMATIKGVSLILH